MRVTEQADDRNQALSTALLYVLLTAAGRAQDVPIENISNDIVEQVEQGSFANSYVFDGSVNPFYL